MDRKGGVSLFCQCFFVFCIDSNKPSTSTWFMNSKLNRKGIVLISRIIANHTLHTVNVVNAPLCECQQNYATVQQKIFDCEMCDRESRTEMLSELKRSGLSHCSNRSIVLRG